MELQWESRPRHCRVAETAVEAVQAVESCISCCSFQREMVYYKILTGQEEQSIIIILPHTNISQRMVQEAQSAGSNEVIS